MHEETLASLKQALEKKHLKEALDNSEVESGSEQNEGNGDYLKESILQ